MFKYNNVSQTSIYAGELLSRFEGGCQSFGCLFKFAVTNHCSLGQPKVKKKNKLINRKLKLCDHHQLVSKNMPQHSEYVVVKN